MSNNIKFLFKDIKVFFNFKKHIAFFGKVKKDSKNAIHKTKYKLKNLFEVNLDNGLQNLYKKNFNDARLRFFLMNIIWKKNSCVHFNTGRVLFYLNKNEKASIFIQNSIDFFDTKTTNCKKFFNLQMADFYQKKIDPEGEIFYVPHHIQRERYDYLVEDQISSSFRRIENTKILSTIFNHYIWFYRKTLNDNQKMVVLDIGCGIGELGEFLKVEYTNSIIIDGIDVSKKSIEYLKEYQESAFQNDEYDELKKLNINSFYKILKISEMHTYLINNLEEGGEKKKYDLIFSFGTFGEFGQIGTILSLCELTLNQNGFLFFYVFEGKDNQLLFNMNDDYFFYNMDYINEVIKQNTNFVIEFIDNQIKIDNNNIIFCVLKKI